MTSKEDNEYMEKAIEASKKCVSEPGKVSPKVGAVVVKNREILAISYRGEQNPGEHAEYTALEKILESEVIAGATVYTTLEPCTTRNHPKLPCAKRLIERKVSRVVIGMLDPNPAIRGKGQILLRDHNIETAMFSKNFAAEVEELNREFRRYIESQVSQREIDTDFIERYRNRDIDDWYKAANYIYADRNFYRDPLSIFAHLVEVIGGLSHLASGKKKSGVTPEEFMSKSIAWWFALCGKLGVKKVSELLWIKFPGVCPYCKREEHDSTICAREKKTKIGPQWQELREIGRHKKRPSSLGEWQRMFRRIYKPHHKPDFEASFARLSEELGELAEAVRVFPYAPGYVLSEAADVFAWLMNIQNNIDYRDENREEDYGFFLEEQYCRAYPDYCVDCTEQRCICPPILENTIGRIAHELPVDPDIFDLSEIFMTPDKARKVFKPPV